MKFLVLTVLLAVIQTSLPVPQKATDVSKRAPQSVKSDAADNQTPSQKPQTIIQPIGSMPDKSDSHTPAADDTPKPIIVRELPPVSVTKDRLDKLYIFLTGVLILVGGLGVRAAYKTLKAIERQGLSMRRQTTHLRRSVIFSRRSANAARRSADAAFLNAQAVINAERPWVMIQIKEDRVDDNAVVIFSRRSFQITIFNYGKTPAHITNCKGPTIKFLETPDSDLPTPPDYGTSAAWNKRFLAPNDSLPIGDPIYPSDIKMGTVINAALEGQRVKGDLVVYGLIEYNDRVSEKGYRTAFCYRYEKMPLSSMGGHLLTSGPAIYNEYT